MGEGGDFWPFFGFKIMIFNIYLFYFWGVGGSEFKYFFRYDEMRHIFFFGGGGGSSQN